MRTDPSSAPRAPVGCTVGLVLPGGGARAAYQVGVLKAVARLFPKAPNPFPVIVGTSAGAVAAAVLATEAWHWQRAVRELEHVWAGFHVEQVFHADLWSMMRAGMHWALSLISGGALLPPPRALFDNTPLRTLLEKNIDWAQLQTSFSRGSLQALAVCATSYTSASSVAFFESQAQYGDWQRQQRIAAIGGLLRAAELRAAHLNTIWRPPRCSRQSNLQRYAELYR